MVKNSRMWQMMVDDSRMSVGIFDTSSENYPKCRGRWSSPVGLIYDWRKLQKVAESSEEYQNMWGHKGGRGEQMMAECLVV